MPASLALSVETAKSIAIIVVLVLLVGAVLSAWLVKSVVAKVVTIVVLAAVALGVWTQRANLQDCADKAKERVGTGQAAVTCTFFGYDVTLE
jgi:protein-S-isoprenylcysteine O-methyltransferase Ste14